MSELQINTTQNVKINFTAAALAERLMAFTIDMILKIGYISLLSMSVGAFQEMDQWSQIGINTLLGLPVVFYTVVLEALMEGQTFGKKIMKIRVVKSDGYQASLADYVVRWFFRIVDIYILGMGFFVILFSKRSQRLGDMAAGTSVILLKDKVDISHTILEDLADDYKPTYPTVIKLSDNDARIIKDTFTTAKSANDYQTLIKLRNKITEVIEVKAIHGTDIQFIDTVLKDYNYYTQSM